MVSRADVKFTVDSSVELTRINQIFPRDLHLGSNQIADFYANQMN